MIDRTKRIAMVDSAEKLSLRRQCSLLSISRGKFYYKSKGEGIVNLHIMKLMDQQYQRTPFYGFPRMFDYVQEACPSWILNKKRVYRLYKLMDLRAIGPNPNTSRPSGNRAYIYPYLLSGLKIERPNQVWASDISFIPMKFGYMYLYAIMDLNSRMIVNWGLSNTMTAQWCASITEEAILLNGRPQIMNTDQGSQFTSEIHTELLKRYDIQISMDGKGRAIDNIFIERFWRTIKYEYIYLHPSNGGKGLYEGIEEYIRFYNHERKHTSIGARPAEKYYGKKMDFKTTKYLAPLV